MTKAHAQKRVNSAVMAAALAGAATASAAPTHTSMPELVITRAAQKPVATGAAGNFTGAVAVKLLIAPDPAGHPSTADVHFEAGARTVWHTHPAGQTLIVTAGVGRVQRWGGPVETIRMGDAVWIPPGVKHWHGAAPDSAMNHIAVTETLEGKNVDWLEAVAPDHELR